MSYFISLLFSALSLSCGTIKCIGGRELVSFTTVLTDKLFHTSHRIYSLVRSICASGVYWTISLPEVSKEDIGPRRHP